MKIVIASMHENAGKTSFITGLAKVTEKKAGYMKPFGDRLVYRDKRLWDHDASLITSILGLEDNPEELTIGFDHSKLKYKYDKESTLDKLAEAAASIEKDKDFLLVEGGKDLSYGASVHLDAITVARNLKAKLVIVIDGNNYGSILDSMQFIKKYINMEGIDTSVIINKVNNVQNFRESFYEKLQDELGLNVVGIIPYSSELSCTTAEYLIDVLVAKVVAGEGGLTKKVKNVFIGSASANAALRNPLFESPQKLIITSGDRSDMILAALETDTSCIILTNNTLPPANILNKATDQNVPLLLVSQDTFRAAKLVDDMVPLLVANDSDKINVMKTLVKQHVDIERIIGD